MIEAWRIVKAEHAADAFTGEGAMLYAGRWHSEGTRVVIIHTDIPEGQSERYETGWIEYYFEPMKKYFGEKS